MGTITTTEREVDLEKVDCVEDVERNKAGVLVQKTFTQAEIVIIPIYLTVS